MAQGKIKEKFIGPKARKDTGEAHNIEGRTAEPGPQGMEFRTSSPAFSSSLGVSVSPGMLTSLSSYARKNSPVGRKHGYHRLQFSNSSSIYKFQGRSLIGPAQV